MKQYTIEYYENGTYEDVKSELILARTKYDAYVNFIKIHPAIFGAWVARYTTQDGKVHYFNTCCGNAY